MIDNCISCGREHETRLGITNEHGYFCCFEHAFNHSRDRGPEARLYQFEGVNRARPGNGKERKRVDRSMVDILDSSTRKIHKNGS